MSKTLYEEAIADARHLKEMAEQNAKNKIIDAVTPQIRRLIERQILGEDAEPDDMEDLDDLEGLTDVLPPEDGELVGLDPLDDESDMSHDLDTMASVEDDTSGTSISVDPDGDVEIHAGGVSVEVELDGDEEDLVLDQQVAEALAAVIRSRSNKNRPTKKQLAERTKRLYRNTKKLRRVIEVLEKRNLSQSQRKMVCNYYTKLLRETLSLKDDVILTERGLSRRSLESHTNNILKEMREMAKRHRRSIFDRLFEGEKESQELDELDALLTLTPEDEEEATEVEDLLGDLEVEFELEDEALPPGEGGEEEAEEGGEEEMDLGAPEEGGEEEELDLGEADDKELDEGDEDPVEEVYEIDESMLRRELRRMRRLREQGEPADADPHLNHGGDDEGDMFVDVDEETLLNALEDELGDAPSPDAGSSLPESRRRRRAAARRPRKANVKEARQNRALRKKLVEYKKAVLALRKQLTEMNLFNAKLLYANKLMQNRNLNQKQQRSIVEALDNARTLREAKLLFKSLTSSLKRSKSGTLTERRNRTLGSSSRSTRRGSSTNNGVGVDRWAVLAGLNKDNS